MKKTKELETEIEYCVRWIQTVPKITNNINTDRSSYGFKHDVERWVGKYISNDSFKFAARRCGLMSVKVSELNECYNLSFNNNNHLTDHQAQVKLCKYFFDTYCIKRKTKTLSFGKFPIEQIFGTYIHQTAFMDALLMTDTRLSSTDYDVLKFDISIKKECRDITLFKGWNTAPKRWEQLQEIAVNNYKKTISWH